MDAKEIVVKTGCYQDLDKIKILAGGDFGIFYLNAEKVLQDKGGWKNNTDSLQMIQYCLGVMMKNPEYNQIIEELAQKVDNYLSMAKSLNNNPDYAISGGETRDWLFSGPVAYLLNLPHMSINKEGKVTMINLVTEEKSDNASGYTTIHIPDMLTKGSSFFQLYVSGKRSGWLPSITDAGSKTVHVVPFLDRMQGGEERIGKYNLKDPITVDSLVRIDDEFLKVNSKNPELAIQSRDEKKFTEDYITKYGLPGFMHEFDPAIAKPGHVFNFLKSYGKFLEENLEIIK